MRQEIDASINKMLSQVPANASVTEKLRVCHDYIVKRVTFSKEAAYCMDIYGAFVGPNLQCEGYAKAATIICDKLGLPSVRITGTDKDGNTHAWNKVQINGKWYNLDLTWDDPKGYESIPNFCRYTYLLVPDAQINNITHFPTINFTPPTANSLDANYFVQNGMYATTVEDAMTMMNTAAKNAISNKLVPVQVKCSSKEVYNGAIQRLKDKGEIWNVINNNGGKDVVEKPSFVSGMEGNLTIQFNLIYK